MEVLVRRVEEFMHQRIPLSKAMNCQIARCNNDAIELRAPAFVNTMEGDRPFSGGLITLGQLASWTLLQVTLRRLDFEPDTRLAKAEWKASETNGYLATAFSVKCSLPADKEWQQFLRMLSRKAQARITMLASVHSEAEMIGSLACEYEAIDLDHQ